MKPEQASKVKVWMPTNLNSGKATDKEATDTCNCFEPPGYWAWHVGRVVWVIGGSPFRLVVAPSTSFLAAALAYGVQGCMTVDAG